jgi:hypothetical protein
MQVERAKAEPQGEALASGERVSNTWVICPEDWDNGPKGPLIPDNIAASHGAAKKGESHFRMSSRPIS